MIKFILLGHGRSGSTLVVKSLAQHPNIRMAGELFHESQDERKRAFEGLNRTYPPDKAEKHYYLEDTDGAKFLREDVFYERPWPEIRAAGFKLFYVHARNHSETRKAWPYLLENKDIRVLHLVRTNNLESFLSLKLALLTKEWKRWKNSQTERAEPPLLTLDPKECRAYFDEKRVWRDWARASFSDHPFFEFEYERDVCRRFQPLMHDIHDFLDVPRAPASELLEKQARKPPREQIANYDELKEYFRYTPHEEFFV